MLTEEDRNQLVQYVCDEFERLPKSPYDSNEESILDAITKYYSLQPYGYINRYSSPSPPYEECLEDCKQFDKKKFDEITELAKKDSSYFYALKDICLNWIKYSEVSPQKIRETSYIIFRGELKKPKADKPSKTGLHRFLVQLIGEVLKHKNIKNVSKNDVTEKSNDAISIVLDAAHKAGVHLTYDGIKQIYKRRHKKIQ